VTAPVAYWDCGFESRRGHGCLCPASVVCCVVKLEVSATVRCLAQRSPTECGVCVCVCVCVCVLVIRCNNSALHRVDEKTSDYARSLHKRPECSCYYHGFVSFPSDKPQFSLLSFAFLEQIVYLSNRHYALLSVERILTLVTYYCSTLLTVTVILSIILTGKLFSWSLNSNQADVFK